jgi:DNA polymerase I
MLRLACSMVTAAGIAVCAPVHDALLIEAPAGDLNQVVAQTKALMRQASRHVLAGQVVQVDAKTVTYPDRYMDEERGRATWERVTALLDTKAQVA